MIIVRVIDVYHIKISDDGGTSFFHCSFGEFSFGGSNEAATSFQKLFDDIDII